MVQMVKSSKILHQLDRSGGRHGPRGLPLSYVPVWPRPSVDIQLVPVVGCLRNMRSISTAYLERYRTFLTAFYEEEDGCEILFNSPLSY